MMFGTKGYRAREAAARERNNRKLVSDEVRAIRAAILAPKIAAQLGEKVAAPAPAVADTKPAEDAKPTEDTKTSPGAQQDTAGKHARKQKAS